MRRAPTPALLIALGAVSALVVWGCDGASEPDAGTSAASAPLGEIENLADNGPVPLSVARRVEAADFTAAREQAGLAPDADLFAAAEVFVGSEGEVGLLARELLGFPVSPFGEVAELKAFDGSQIEAAAGTVPIFGEPGTLVIRTSQSYEEIESELLDAGLESRDGILVSGADQGNPAYFPNIADAGDGLVVLSDQREIGSAGGNGGAARAAQQRGEDGTAARLADRIEPSRPYVMAIASRNKCVESAVARQGVAPLAGEIELTGTIEASDVEIVPSFSRTHTVSGPTSRSGRVEIKSVPRDGFERDAVAFTELLDKGRAVRYGC